MQRARIAWGLVFLAVSLSVSCGGGGSSSPTEPEPVPESLAGEWTGELSGVHDGQAFTCSLNLTLDEVDAGVFLGSWRAGCADGDFSGLANAIDVGLAKFLVAFPPGEEGLLACGWGGDVELRGNRLTGDWTPPDNCEEPVVPEGGPIELVFQG